MTENLRETGTMARTTAPALASLDEILGGSLLSPLRDPFSVYRRLRSEEPVLAFSAGGETRYFVSRHEDVEECLRNDEVYSNRSNVRGISLVMGPTIIEKDGREHLKHRNLVTPALAPRALKGDFPKRVREIADQLIDRFSERGSADLVSEFTFSYPLRVFAEILGIPVDRLDEFHQWAIDVIRVSQDPGRGFAASRALAGYLGPIVDERRRVPADDLISRLAQARVDGEMLTDDEVVSFLRLLILAGAETTYHLMGSALFALLHHRPILESVLLGQLGVRRVIDETLRWESPVQIVTRETLAPVVLHGVAIPAGADLTVGIGSANRDERRFADPDRFDPTRTDLDHIAFGFGKHYCAGSRLAYLEAEIGLQALLERIGPSLELERDAECAIVGGAFRGPDRLPVRFRSGSTRN